MFKSSIAELIKSNKSVFEDINNAFDTHTDNADYTILDYNKILTDMCDYINGYFKYKENGEEQYADKLMSSTHHFYDEMFTNIKYRTPFRLTDMKDINEKFLVNTKKLQALLDTDVEKSTEENSMLKMTDNQYNKLMKVYRDDSQIYLHLLGRNTRFTKPLPTHLYAAFNDYSTPVIHRIKKGKGD